MRLKQTTVYMLFLLVSLLLPGRWLHAQEAQVIVGRVTDPSGAVISKAKVTITRQSTDVVARTLETSSAGMFTAPGLTVDAYNVRVEARGFRTFEKTGVVVDLYSTVQVDAPLTLGTETQDVIVEGNPVAVQTQTRHGNMSAMTPSTPTTTSTSRAVPPSRSCATTSSASTSAVP